MEQPGQFDGRLEHALLAVDRAAVQAELGALLAARPPLEVFEQALAPALERVGRGWEAGRVSLSQVYMAGRLAEEVMLELLPPGAALKAGGPRLGVAVLEDRHVLGKRLVVAALRAGGHEPIDLGSGLGVAELAARTVEERLDVLLVSTLMLRAALRVRDLVAALRARGARARVLVGGAPFRFDPGLWREVGADACGERASEAPRLVAQLLGGAP